MCLYDDANSVDTNERGNPLNQTPERKPWLLKQTKRRDAVERQFVRETGKHAEQQNLDRAVNVALLHWIAAASQSTLLVRVELTFKLRVMTALGKRTRAVAAASEPVVRYDRPFPKRRRRLPLREVEGRGCPARADGAVPTWKITAVDDSAVQNVRAAKNPQRRPSLKSAPLFVTSHALPTNEPARVAVTLMNALNRHFFKGRSRRATNPERLTAFVCVHDRDEFGSKCRPHVHALVALPPKVTVAEFTAVVRRAVDGETFINRRLLVEPVADVAASVFYNAKPIGLLPDDGARMHPCGRTAKPQGA